MGKVETFDKAPIVWIVTLLLLTLNLFAFLAKVIVKFFRRASFTTYDDLILTIAMLLAIIQSSLQCARAAHGFGRPIENLSAIAVETSLKLELASTVLYICSITLSKISPAATIMTLTPSRQHNSLVKALIATMILIAVSSVLVVCLQCHLPHSWDYTKGGCIDRVTFWTAFDILNVFTDAILIILPVYLILSVQLKRSNKIYYSLAFGARICAIAAFISDAVVWNQSIRPASPVDTFFEEWQTSVTMQVIQASCLVSACAVFLGRFFRETQSGWGLDTTINTSVPIELRVGRFSSIRSNEALASSAAPLDGSYGVRSSVSGRERQDKVSNSDGASTA